MIQGLSDIQKRARLLLIKKGGPGSGHHGHQGRPGQRGGSTSSGGVARFTTSDRQRLRENYAGTISSISSSEDKDELENFQGIGVEETLALRVYTSSMVYAEANAKNRGLMENDDDNRLLTRFADSALEQIKPSFKGDLYRGIDVPDDFRGDAELWIDNTFVVGSEYSDSSFMSTSWSQDSAERYMGGLNSTQILLNIKTTSGRAKDVSDISLIGGDNEVLFPRNSRFNVLEINYNPDIDRYTIHLNEITTKRLSRKNKEFLKALQKSDENLLEQSRN